MAKNSLDQKVFFTPPTLITLEGTVVSYDKGGVNFKYRKPGSQTYYTEYFPYNAKFLACVGDAGKEGTLYLLGHSEVYGGKVRNELVAQEVSSHIEGYVKASTDAGTAIFASSHVAFRAEDTSGNKKGRGKKAAKPEKTEKAAKGDKASKKKKKAEAEDELWED